MRNKVTDLNEMNPAAKSALLGDRLDGDITLVNEMKAKLNAMIAFVFGDRLVAGSTGLAIGSNDITVGSALFYYHHTGLLKTKIAVDTALAAGTIPADKWGIYRFSVGLTGTITSTPGAANFTTGYDDEAAAIAALPAVPAGGIDMGYATILTASGQTFVGGTDALQGGTGGNPSDDTNYYSAEAVTPVAAVVAPDVEALS